LAVEVEALAELWNVSLACSTAANENEGAGHWLKFWISSSYLCQRQCEGWRLGLKRDTQEKLKEFAQQGTS
jgi:hypothetical protein